MRVTDECWGMVPDFSDRLAAAMDYAGLTNRQLSERLNELGLEGMNPNHVHRLLKGRSDQPESRHANPTFIVIAGMSRACGVPVQWFFSMSDSLIDEQDTLIERYAENLLAD
ncbi:helix-turn-helix domain-containing protein [Flexivirga meconopsidis]|uniref:helix-turn-helix domain-containing protein n=1 Tax=Flexivirga meconopsidis TaxID=2977121 RepID=UPI002240BB67|nr:helix-turn-helix transcriptional regulator [Flexivirga meconopsidis]